MKCMVIVHNYIFLRNYVLATPRYPPQVFGFHTRIHYRGFHPQFVITARRGVFLPIYVLRWLLQNFWKWQYMILLSNPITNVVKYRKKRRKCLLRNRNRSHWRRILLHFTMSKFWSIVRSSFQVIIEKG